MEGNLSKLIENKKLKFVFVGGKGGVGKTTTSSAIALAMCKNREKVLIISTDPAHNLADAFNQQLSSEPTLINGTPNLYGMEIDPKKSFEQTNIDKLFKLETQETDSITDLIMNVPGIDEAIVVINLLKLAKENNFDLIIFDTAPTGHTVKLLGYPAICQKLLEKILNIKDKLGAVANFFGTEMKEKIEAASTMAVELKADAETLIKLMRDSEITTFVAVCIPEFLSVYETERLVQELANQNIDIFNLVVNQIVFPQDNCSKCLARYKMQHKYIDQINQLYEDFHVCLMPLEDEEVRGILKLTEYSNKLICSRELPNTIQFVNKI